MPNIACRRLGYSLFILILKVRHAKRLTQTVGRLLMKLIANFAYAGTDKFVSYLLDGDKTLCGMEWEDLKNRPAEWEEIELTSRFMGVTTTEPMIPGCIKCQRAQQSLHSDALPTNGASAENQPGKAPVS